MAVGDSRRGDRVLRAERNLKIAALYDVHGVLAPLEAVLDDVEREDVDLIVLGGDCIHGPQPRETLERLRGLGDRAVWLRGNTDRLLAEDDDPESAHAQVARLVGDETVAFLRNLPLVYRADRVLFCHATPWSDDAPIDDRPVDADVVVYGHTHVQRDERRGTVRWVNAGSVGLPRDEASSAWALLDHDRVELRRTALDLEAVLDALRSVGAENWVAELAQLARA